jgi:hypothetical protein
LHGHFIIFGVLGSSLKKKKNGSSKDCVERDGPVLGEREKRERKRRNAKRLVTPHRPFNNSTSLPMNDQLQGIIKCHV